MKSETIKAKAWQNVPYDSGIRGVSFEALDLGQLVLLRSDSSKRVLKS